MKVTVAELKNNLSAILRKAANGEEITVTKHGKPYVTLKNGDRRKELPRVGAFDGQFKVPDDWDDMETGFNENGLPVS